MPWKLVRDKILDLMKEGGKNPNTKILTDQEIIIALTNKLVEEANEVRHAVLFGDHKKVVEELADVSEVLFALAKVCDIHPFIEVEAERQRKRDRKGGFDKRIFMEF
jgi:predicted house-cleaning noncanonical NTP pyrophosphatase (MazG superfamily)